MKTNPVCLVIYPDSVHVLLCFETICEGVEGA